MTAFLMIVATVILLALAVSLVRVVRGPTAADRMMAAQLMGTGGVAVLLLVGAADPAPGVVDVALVLALLAGLAAVAFVKAQSADGSGDPEAEP